MRYRRAQATPIVCATKGIENDSLLTMHEVLEDVLPTEMHPTSSACPAFVRQGDRAPVAHGGGRRVALGKMAQRVQRCFSNDYFRVYTSMDVAEWSWEGR